MGDMEIEISNKDGLSINDKVDIEVSLGKFDDIKYKFLEGYEGVWSPIQDFSANNKCTWVPKNIGDYMIMVQGKHEDSSLPFDFKEITNVTVKDNTRLIKNVDFEKSKLYLGDKINIKVEGATDLLLYRFWIRGVSDWEPLRDYSNENTFEYTANSVGNKEILIECKSIESENNFDDFTTIKLEVKDINEIEIVDFKMFTNRLLVNEELVFEVKVNYDSNRPLLYKFLKFSGDGKVTCVQDFSSKNRVAFKETVPGEYKLLCLVRDMLSGNEYDDRAQIIYKIKPYEKVKIKNFSPDIVSPQAVETSINLDAVACGGRELLYRYVIDGPIAEDSGYIRSTRYLWRPEEEGTYNVSLKVKDISYKGDYEDICRWSYKINEKGDRPIRIDSITCDKGKKSLVGQPVNITIKCSGGTKVSYTYIIYKDGKRMEKIGPTNDNWVSYVPEECGEYEIEARVKDMFSVKEFDSSISAFVQISDYIPASIDYILAESREIYLVNDNINLEVIMQNTTSCKLRFVTKINGQEVEDTGYVDEKKLVIKPRCPGKYTVEIYAKNIKSTAEFDCKKDYSIYVHDSIPVNSTKVSIIADDINIGKDITFTVTSQGGKDVCYEFYIMDNKNWTLVQAYSKKEYYSFIPFKSGKYKLLVLSKSYFKKINYEDYQLIEFEVQN